MKIKGSININIDLDLGDLVPGPVPEPEPEPEPGPIVNIPSIPFTKSAWPLPDRLLDINSEWYRDIINDPVDQNSLAILSFMNYRKEGSLFGQYWIHPDFGGDSGIPYSLVGGKIDAGKLVVDAIAPALVPIGPIKWADESDKLDGKFAYPTPLTELVREIPGDHHVLIYDAFRKKLFELFGATPVTGVGWKVGSASIWEIDNILGDKQRTLGFTSACAAGIPMIVGLLKYDEVVNGNAANHALMFSTPNVHPKLIANPARHWVSVDPEQSNMPMLGTRVRIKATFDETKYTGPVLGIIKTLKKYGAICVDRSGNLGFGLLGTQDNRWQVEDLAKIKADSKTSPHLRNQGFLDHLEVVKPAEVLTKPSK
jgi:hypothetical protein